MVIEQLTLDNSRLSEENLRLFELLQEQHGDAKRSRDECESEWTILAMEWNRLQYMIGFLQHEWERMENFWSCVKSLALDAAEPSVGVPSQFSRL